MIYSVLVNVPTAGTPVPIRSTRTMVAWAKVQADPENGGLGYLLGVDPTTKEAAAITAGQALSAGGSLDVYPASDTNFIDLNKVYLDAANSNEDFRVMYATR